MSLLPMRRELRSFTATRGAGRGGPCNPGGVSPSLHLAPQSVTGPLFTGAGLPTPRGLRFGFLEPKPRGVGAPPSSGPDQSQAETKASRPAPLVSHAGRRHGSTYPLPETRP